MNAGLLLLQTRKKTSPALVDKEPVSHESVIKNVKLPWKKHIKQTAENL